MQDSLPAAGPALPGGIGYPQGSCERFHGCNDSPFPSFLHDVTSLFEGRILIDTDESEKGGIHHFGS